jgi:catechol 2,3-dioxygenase-like lactoylglutathione lyase family enzyme
MTTTLFGPVMQLGFVVPDLEAAIAHWRNRIGLGPFFVLSGVEFAELRYRGQPTEVQMAVALAQWGEVQVELIQQLNAAPSIYEDYPGRALGGLQHVGVMTDSLDAHLARLAPQGLQPVQWGATANGIRFAYLETDEIPGSMVELIESGPAINEFFALVRRAAQGWDGSDPVRRL